MPSSNLLRASIVALAVVAVDRASKVWVVEVLDLRNRLVLPVWEPVLNLTMAWNQGINFGLFDMGSAGRWVLVAVAMAIVAALVVWLRRARGRVEVLGAGAIIGGALGNVWDRIEYGAVADFLNVSCCGIRNPFAFNVADAAIFGGVLALLVFGRGDDGRERDGA